LAAVTLFLLAGSLFAENAPKEAAMPDVLIWVDARNASAGQTAISFTYRKLVKEADAQAELTNLLQLTGWKITGLQIKSDSPNVEMPMTSVEFTAGNTIDWNSKNLPIEPVITAFKARKNIQILFLVPAEFSYAGIDNFENKYVKIALTRGNGSYSYNVDVKDSGFKKLGLPAPDLGEKKSGKRSTAGTVFVIVLALIAAFIAYIITDRAIKRNR
jgi:hypothetical protein